MSQLDDLQRLGYTLTHEEVDFIERILIDHGKGRLHNFAEDFSESDYIAGACAVMDALGAWGQVPPKWVIGQMAGNSLITGERFPEPKTVRVRIDRLAGLMRFARSNPETVDGYTPVESIADELERLLPEYYDDQEDDDGDAR